MERPDKAQTGGLGGHPDAEATRIWLVGYWVELEQQHLEIGGAFTTKEAAREAALVAKDHFGEAFIGPLELDAIVPLETTHWEGHEWV